MSLCTSPVLSPIISLARHFINIYTTIAMHLHLLYVCLIYSDIFSLQIDLKGNLFYNVIFIVTC